MTYVEIELEIEDRTPPTADSPRSVAVVVLEGVGDMESGDAGRTARTVAENLSRTVPAYRLGEGTAVKVTVPQAARSEEWDTDGEIVSFPREVLTLEDHGTTRVEVIEMPWADLSRFPKGLKGFVINLFALGLQLVTPGLEVLRGAFPAERKEELKAGTWVVVAFVAALLGGLAGMLASHLGGGAGATLLAALATAGMTLLIAVVVDRPYPAGVAHSLGSATSWFIASIVVPFTAVVAVLVTAFWLVIDETVNKNDAIVPLLVGIPGALLIWALGKGITDGGWGYGGGGWKRVLDTRWWAMGMFIAVTGMALAFYLSDGRSLRRGLADTLLYAGGFGLRAVWLGAATLVGVTLLSFVALAAAELIRRRWRSGGAEGRRRWVTASLCVTLSPLVVALFGTMIFAGIAGVTLSSAKDARWGRDAQDVRCLQGVDAWSVSRACGSKGEQQWVDSSKRIVHLLDVAAAERGDAADKRAATPPEDLAGADTLEKRAASNEAQAAALEAAAGATPVDWASSILVIVGAGSIIAILMGLTPLILAALAFGLFLATAAGRRGRAGRLSAARSLTRMLALVDHATPALVLIAFALAGTGWVWVVWTRGGWAPVQPWDGFGTSQVAAAGFVAGVLAVIGRFAPVDPRGMSKDVGGHLETVRRIVDLPYDIATYLRIAHDGKGARPRIIARHRALLRHMRDSGKGYDAIVFAAHSQGSMLVLATLLGDPHRQEAEAAGDGGGVVPWTIAAPPAPRVSVVSFGCPIRQTYGARLPGDYDFMWSSATPLAPVNVEWTNLYRAGDYVGRAVFHDPLDPRFSTPGSVFMAPLASDAVIRRDVCLLSKGGHTGYFSDPGLAPWLDVAIRHAAGLSGLGSVDGYTRSETSTSEWPGLAGTRPRGPSAESAHTSL